VELYASRAGLKMTVKGNIRKLMCLPEKRKGRGKEEYNRGTISRDFVENATMHGIGKVHGATRTFSRLFWMVLFFTVVCVVIYQVVQLLQKMYEYEVVTSIRTENNVNSVKFPTVTICNSNPHSIKAKKRMEKRFNKTMADAFDVFEKAKDEEIEEIGEIFQQKESFFQPGYCRFGKKGGIVTDGKYTPFCRYDDATKTVQLHPTHLQNKTLIMEGNCYVFNPEGAIRQSQPGVKNGLFLILNIDQVDYNPLHSETDILPAGVLVTIHTQYSEPDVSSLAYLASPGTLTRFAVQKVQLKRSKAPYPDDCQDIVTRDLLPCLQDCFADEMLKRCEAVDKETAIRKRSPDYPKPINLTQFNCARNFSRNLDSLDRSICNCPASCIETSYTVVPSQSSWPSDNALPEWTKLAKEREGRTDLPDDFVSKNYVAIVVYYKDFMERITQRAPAYNVNMFFSDLGGQLGLWIGASIFSILELFAFILELILYRFLHDKDDDPKKQPSVEAGANNPGWNSDEMKNSREPLPHAQGFHIVNS